MEGTEIIISDNSVILKASETNLVDNLEGEQPTPQHA